jgi:hypothetical protein
MEQHWLIKKNNWRLSKKYVLDKCFNEVIGHVDDKWYGIT